MANFIVKRVVVEELEVLGELKNCVELGPLLYRLAPERVRGRIWK
jgi:hypothetical protein